MTEKPEALPEQEKGQTPKELIHLRDQLFNSPAPEAVNADQVFRHTKALYLSDEKAWHWLGLHCPALGGRPMDFMSTPEDCGQVIRVLFAKYHSVYL